MSLQRLRRLAGPAAAVVLAGVLATPGAAVADATVNDPLCLAGTTGSGQIPDSAPVYPVLPVFNWTTNLSSYCSGQTLSLLRNGVPVETVTPGAHNWVVPGLYIPAEQEQSVQFTVHLQTATGGGKDLASGTLDYVPRPGPFANPPGTVEITGNGPDQQVKFLQAVQTPNTRITIAGTVNLDLSGLEQVIVAPGVTIGGKQDVVPAGPRLFTTTFPKRLFAIGNGSPSYPAYSDNVLISGIRLDGGMSDDPYSAVGKPDSTGIVDFGSIGLQIDHNDLSHWRGAAVEIQDGNSKDVAGHPGRINQDNAATVHIHDNYLHHNQHPSTSACLGSHASGYGVETSNGAYALIDRNVFDFNRHDVAGDGSYGTGYLLRDNLLLANGGVHANCAGVTFYTHAIDMHGVDDCWSRSGDHNCGRAGEYMDVSYNTVTYAADSAIHLRGTPTKDTGAKSGMEVTHNVFAHSTAGGAMEQNDSGLTQSDNVFDGLGAFNDRRSCDFDGDGKLDSFAAPGTGWWYRSSQLAGRWVFLRRSATLVADIGLGDFDGDGRCDLKAGGQVFYNPSPFPAAHNPGAIQQNVNTSANVQLSAGGGQSPYTWSVIGLPPGVSADASGHLTGRASVGGAWVGTVIAKVTDAAQQTSTVTFTWRVVAIVPNLLSEYEKDARAEIAAAGLVVGTVSTINNCVDKGSVQVQSPSGGAAVNVGSAVNFTLSTCTTTGGGGGEPK